MSFEPGTGDLAISARGLSKAYVLRHRPDGAGAAAAAATNGSGQRGEGGGRGGRVIGRVLRALRPASRETFWSLRDVSFDVPRGQIVGIIGKNGAGKSTLLKILSRITRPTAGRAELDGRVGSLLEVGTGFHPELTGRENIFLNGSVLGMRRAEIRDRFDAIVDFSGVHRFLDTPVKRYSSGMYVRLAFSVAAHLSTEVLIVDEVLAVGDAEFQRKCLGKMQEVSTTGGRTVLFVSHNMTAVQGLCQRAIWLDGGRVRGDGAAGDIIRDYLASTSSRLLDRTWPDAAIAPGNEHVRVRRASVRPADEDPACARADRPITTRTPLTVEFEFWNLDAGAHLNLSVLVATADGTIVFNTIPFDEPRWHGRAFPRGLFRSGFRVPGDLLNDGTHRVHLLIVRDQTVVLFRMDDALVFEVVEDVDVERRKFWHGKWKGVVRPALAWSTQLIDESEGGAGAYPAAAAAAREPGGS